VARLCRAVAAATTGVAVGAYLKPRLDRALRATVGSAGGLRERPSAGARPRADES